MRSPLDGMKILDLTIWQNGPWATVMLSDMGADVIKIEDPVKGDPGRGFSSSGNLPAGHPQGRVNSYFQTMNRNKKSMTLDLKKPEGREVFYRMAKTADIVTQNFRVGVVEKLGVDYETIKKINPKIIYGSVSGLGPKGPDAREGIFDILGQARGGFMSLVAATVGYPTNAAQSQADQTGAIILAHALLLAIIARERYGIGQHVQTSQLGGQLILQALILNAYLLNGEMPRSRHHDVAPNPLFNTYRCGDGRWLALGCVQADRYWEDFCRVLDIEGLAADPRFATMPVRNKHCRDLIAVLDRAFATQPRDAWIAAFKKSGVLSMPVQTYDELPKDPQVIANDYFAEIDDPALGILKEVGVPFSLSETPGAPRSAAPEFGAHTEGVLLGYGYTWEEIGRLREAEVI